GYSFRYKRFFVWRLFYNHTERTFQHEPIPRRFGIGPIAFAGDWSVRAVHELQSLLDARSKSGPLTRSGPTLLDLEPFEVIRDVLRSARPDASIGGPDRAPSNGQQSRTPWRAGHRCYRSATLR